MDLHPRQLARALIRRVFPEPPRLGFPYGNYLVCDRHRFVYCFVPKSASTTLKSWFLEALGEPASALTGLAVHEHADSAQHVLRLRPRDEALRILEKYFKFAFVRDPRQRLVSAYLSKLVRGSEVKPAFRPRIEAIQRSAGRTVEVEQGVTFDQFVRYLHASPDTDLDPHWKPQASFLAGHRFDFVGCVERIDEDLPLLGKQLGLAAPHTPRNQTRYRGGGDAGRCFANATRAELTQFGTGREFPSSESFYSQELSELVLERYRADFEIWSEASTRTRAAITDPARC